MTDISDETLDDLLANLRLWIGDQKQAADAITALRARVRELEEVKESHFSYIKAFRAYRKTARQVTREQIKLAAENMVYDIETGVSDYDVAAMMAKSFGLEITGGQDAVIQRSGVSASQGEGCHDLSPTSSEGDE